MTSPPKLYYVLQILVPAILIIAGWIVVYKNSLKIEARKEAREFVDQMDSLIDGLQEKIVTYYTNNNAHIGSLSASIKADFQLISHYLFIIQGMGIRFTRSDVLTNYRKSATGGFFETTKFRDQRGIPGWDAEIAGLAAQLKLSVRRAYVTWSGNYKPPKKIG